MPGLRFTWMLRYQGWAFCTIADDHGQAEAIASDITYGPEDLLDAVTSLAQGAATARAEFEGEPTAFRWFFKRDGTHTEIRLVKAPDRDSPDSEGSVIWSGRHSIDALARAILAAFHQAVSDLGSDNYRAQWGRPFPASHIETLQIAAQKIAEDQQTLSAGQTRFVAIRLESLDRCSCAAASWSPGRISTPG